MKLWKKAAGLIKDRNSIWVASISRRTSFRNPDLEAIIIKATSHDEAYVDYKNFHRVYQWVRTSPLYLKPLLCAISTRMEKTRSWVVALKGLMLMHGIFCCKIPAVQMIGRLPFDLSNFCDRHSKPTKTWAYDAFVRTYFTYLDQRSAFLNTLAKKNKADEDDIAMLDELGRLQKWQSLLDMLLEIKPETSPSHFLKNNITSHSKNNKVYLISEATICLLTEIFDVYSRVCKGIAKSLVRIYAYPGKTEAQLALGIVQKAANQGEDLSMYLDFCRDLGILSEADCPKVEQIAEEDIRDLERIINEATTKKENETGDEQGKRANKAIVVRDEHQQQHMKTNSKTIITDKWEVFEDDTISWVSADTSGFSDVGSTFTSSCAVTAPPSYYRNPFAVPNSDMSMVPYVPSAAHNQVLPDLISF